MEAVKEKTIMVRITFGNASWETPTPKKGYRELKKEVKSKGGTITKI